MTTHKFFQRPQRLLAVEKKLLQSEQIRLHKTLYKVRVIR